jgi:MFS family permease
MHKSLVACAAAAVIVAATLAPTDAYARNRGGAVAAGIIGGLAAGAIIGGAIANSYPPPPVYYAPAPAYGPPPAYYAEPACHVERQRVWDGYAWRVRRVEVCD